MFQFIVTIMEMVPVYFYIGVFYLEEFSDAVQTCRDGIMKTKEWN